MVCPSGVKNFLPRRLNELSDLITIILMKRLKVNINWREVYDLISMRKMLVTELKKLQATTEKLEQQQNQAVSPDVTVPDLIEIFADERDRLLVSLGQADDKLAQFQQKVAGDQGQHNRLLEIWRRSSILAERP